MIRIFSNLLIFIGFLFIGIGLVHGESGTTQAMENVENVINLDQVSQRASHLGVKILVSLFVGFLGFLLLKCGVFLLNILSERAARYRFLKKMVPAYQAFVWVLIGYVIVEWVFNPTKETFFAFLTASGVAIGFAAQDILKNVFGGITIILDRPFQIGDKIRVGEYYGEVIQIGIRTTRIVTPDDSIVSVPNSEIVNKAVSNANSGDLDCQVVTEIDVPSGVNLMEARTVAWEAAATSQYVYLKKPIAIVMVDSPTPYVTRTRLKIKAYVVDTRLEFAFATDVAESVKEEFRKRGWIRARNKKELTTIQV